MNRNKSMSKYHQAIEMCFRNKDKTSLFLGNKINDFNRISDLLTNNSIPFELDKTKDVIILDNNSKIYFEDAIEKGSLSGLEFNYLSIHKTEVNHDFIKNRERLLRHEN